MVARGVVTSTYYNFAGRGPARSAGNRSLIYASASVSGVPNDGGAQRMNRYFLPGYGLLHRAINSERRLGVRSASLRSRKWKKPSSFFASASGVIKLVRCHALSAKRAALIAVLPHRREFIPLWRRHGSSRSMSNWKTAPTFGPYDHRSWPVSHPILYM